MLITLSPMTKELAQAYYKNFELDPDLYLDKSQYIPYQYDEEQCNMRVERYASLGRVFMAVMLDGKPVGEVVLKNIDYQQGCCTMGISMVNDDYKNKGYGTSAEKMIISYAFETLKMNTVLADAVITNLRSRHVLEKIGFKETHRDDTFVYYRFDRM